MLLFKIQKQALTHRYLKLKNPNNDLQEVLRPEHVHLAQRPLRTGGVGIVHPELQREGDTGWAMGEQDLGTGALVFLRERH